MIKNRLYIKLICVLLCFALVLPVAAQFSRLSEEDLSEHWASETMIYWDNTGLFDKIPENEFGVDKDISRGAFVHIFNSMITVPEQEKQEHSLTDIKESDWNYDDIVTAYNVGYITGYPDNTFRADEPITREEMSTIVSKYYKLNIAYDDTKLNNFTDKEKVQSYAVEHVASLAELGIVNGYPDSTFRPQNNITFAEAVTIITRFLAYINGGSGVSGRVYYDNKPIYNADISVYADNSTTLSAQGTSDLYGDYIIDVPNGTYDITFTKDNRIVMLPDVKVNGEVRTYNKAILKNGQNVTATITDKGIAVSEKEVYIQGDSCVTLKTDNNGALNITLPENGEYSLKAEVNGKIKEITKFKTTTSDKKLDLGKIALTSSTGIIAGKITFKDDDSDDEPSKLPYREPKTMEELVEINDGEQPMIEVDSDNNVSLYIGKISDNKVEDVNDVIAELNAVSDLLGFEDSREEFTYTDNGILHGATYKLQQIYNGIPVMTGQLIVSTENGQIASILSNYQPEIKQSNISTVPNISENQAIDIIVNKYDDSIEIQYIVLVIDNNSYQLIYDCGIIHNYGFRHIVIDAINGIIIDDTKPSDSFNTIGIYDSNKPEIIPSPIYYDDRFLVRNTSCKIKNHSSTTYYPDENVIKNLTSDMLISKDSDFYTNFLKVYNTYNSIANHKSVDGNGKTNLKCTVNATYKENFLITSSWDNAVAWFDLYNGEQAFSFGKNNMSLTTIGHEYTHAVAKFLVKPIEDSSIQMAGLGYSYNEDERISSNISFLETSAISEGFSDVMGILINNIDKNAMTCEDIKYGDYEYNPALSDSKNRTYHKMKEYYKPSNKLYFGCGCYYPCDKLVYMTGVGHNDRFICGGILHEMVRNKFDNPKTLFLLWYTALKELHSEASFFDLRNALLGASNELKCKENEITAIKIAFDTVGIYSKEFKTKTEKWYNPSLSTIFDMNIIDNLGLSDVTNGNQNLNEKQYIQLLVNFCNSTGANLKVKYKGNVATLSKSSDPSMSLIFDESKDILRWEAFIIASRILNYCHAELKNAGWSAQYNYAYKTGDTDHYTSFLKNIKVIQNTEIDKIMKWSTDFISGMPDDKNYNSVLDKYYGGISYEEFKDSYMIQKDENNSKSQYPFNILTDELTPLQHMITTEIFNMYMSLGKKYSAFTNHENITGNSSEFDFTEPMTLASACYLLYSYIR